MRRLKAFTLIELLVVIAIIAILAAILFPVFAQAKVAAKKIACLSNSKQFLTSTHIYLADFDDTFPIIQWINTYDANPANPDKALGNLMQPYMKNFDILRSPASPSGVTERDTSSPVPSTSVPAYRQAQFEFNMALKADYGQNTQYYSVMNYCGAVPFKAAGTPQTMVQVPASSIYAINSIWDRTASGGVFGGGNWGLDPPCRRLVGGADTFPPLQPGCIGRWWWGGWNPANPLAWNVFGGAWPYHSEVANVAFADSHARSMRMTAVTAGCDVRNGWTGYIFDRDAYIWDLQ